MVEQENKNEEQQPNKDEQNKPEKLDAASKYLSEALGLSFVILKAIMILLVILFLAFGFKMIDSDEQAIVLRFGKIRGSGEDRILGPGLHWVFPYPIDEIVRIQVEKKINLPVNSFWYFQSDRELLGEIDASKYIRPNTPLSPIMDGYCITRSETQSVATSGDTGSDYNIIHSKWQITYKIDNPERFFRNVYIEEVKPGESYADVITKSISPMLERLVESSVVTAMVNYTIDEALSSQDRIPKHVQKLLQDKLDTIESGIVVVSALLTDITWPRQTNYAFQAAITASQKSQTAINEAYIEAENMLNEVAGPVSSELLAMLHDDNLSDQEKQNSPLWKRLSGAAQEQIAGSKAYKTKLVETAKANADYLHRILPEYRKRPKLVIQKIYQDAIEQVFNDADEKMIIQPTSGAKGREVRIQLNRDPQIKPKAGQQK